MPKFESTIASGLLPADIVPHDEQTIGTIKNVIGLGRRSASLRHHARYRIKMPFGPPGGQSEDKRRNIYSRGYVTQGSRYDQKLERDFHTDGQNGFHCCKTVEERIDTDQRYRLHLARDIVNCQANFSPPQVILSRYCLLAFETCLQRGELDRGHIGEKKRQIREREFADFV
jgi:hypothetical protein